MGSGAWQLSLNAVLAPEYAHAITSFRFNKTVPLLGRFQDAAAVCLFYFLLLRVPPLHRARARPPARVAASLRGCPPACTRRLSAMVCARETVWTEGEGTTRLAGPRVRMDGWGGAPPQCRMASVRHLTESAPRRCCKVG